MAFTKERVQLVFLIGREGWSYRRISNEFNVLTLGRSLIDFFTAAKVIRKVKKTGSIIDKLRSGWPSVSIKRNCNG